MGGFGCLLIYERTAETGGLGLGELTRFETRESPGKVPKVALERALDGHIMSRNT